MKIRTLMLCVACCSIMIVLSACDDTSGDKKSVTGPYLAFAADDGTNGRELWVTDGTADGTKMLVDINTTAGAGSGPVISCR